MIFIKTKSKTKHFKRGWKRRNIKAVNIIKQHKINKITGFESGSAVIIRPVTSYFDYFFIFLKFKKFFIGTKL